MISPLLTGTATARVRGTPFSSRSGSSPSISTLVPNIQLERSMPLW